jgi:hypothetical protein
MSRFGVERDCPALHCTGLRRERTHLNSKVSDPERAEERRMLMLCKSAETSHF